MRKFPPYPKRPHSSGQAKIKLHGKPKYLGVFGTPESWAEYQRLLTEWRSGATDTAIGGTGACAPVRLVRDLVAAYLKAARAEYTEADGSVREEFTNIRNALPPLLALYGHTPVSDFGPKALRALLAAVAKGGWAEGRRPWSRRYANANLARWRAVWKWAESEQLVPAGTYHALATAPGLRTGKAVEHEEVAPVPERHYYKTLPKLGPIVRQAVELLYLTGARPSELLRLTPGQIDRGGVVEIARGHRVTLPPGVWAYCPTRHKTAYRGHKRVILIGPQAQKVLNPLLEGLNESEPVFSPRRARALRQTAARGKRKTKVQPSQESRARPGARQPGERYTVTTLRQAIERACARAKVPTWTPYQLRHNAGTRLRDQFGPEIARIALGHRHLSTTAIYTLDNLGAAAKAISEAG